MEDAQPDLDLATATGISGAALGQVTILLYIDQPSRAPIYVEGGIWQPILAAKLSICGAGPDWDSKRIDRMPDGPAERANGLLVYEPTLCKAHAAQPKGSSGSRPMAVCAVETRLYTISQTLLRVRITSSTVSSSE